MSLLVADITGAATTGTVVGLPGIGLSGSLVGTGGGLFVTSVNAVLHVPQGASSAGGSRLSPYVSGGYTRMSSGEGAFDGWNVGAGTDVWLRSRVGMRVEVRDHVRPDSRGAVHYWAIRAGVAFR